MIEFVLHMARLAWAAVVLGSAVEGTANGRPMVRDLFPFRSAY
jgi:hypothetical protein